MSYSAARSAAGIGDEDVSIFFKASILRVHKKYSAAVLPASIVCRNSADALDIRLKISLAFTLYFPAARAIMCRTRLIQRQVDQH